MKWRHVTTWHMAQFGAYTLDDLNQLHWRRDHRAALRIRDALRRHGIRAIQTPHARKDARHPGQGHGTPTRAVANNPGDPKASGTHQQKVF